MHCVELLWNLNIFVSLHIILKKILVYVAHQDIYYFNGEFPMFTDTHIAHKWNDLLCFDS